MALHLASLNSGSNGNCYYVGNENDAVLIDAGISCRDTERRMHRLGLSLKNVRAIFISHEHTDHTRGAEVLSRRHGIPVYLTPTTHLGSGLNLDDRLLRMFAPDEPVEAGELTVLPFQKPHDGIDPHSFLVTGHGITAGIFTDIGAPSKELIRHLGQCHAAFLESNYDEKMLEEGRYPIYLKRRIRGGLGHLSNSQSLELFLKHRAPFLELLILSHLSAINNRPEIVAKLFAPHANGTQIEIASRYGECGVFKVTGEH